MEKQQTKHISHHKNEPPRNPNKRTTTINLKRTIERMEANDREAIRQAR
ncbi:hypothetical protein [Oceanobacillus timonensis]|nr:hypothetical protein [Oceanobacillus timonensis]